MHFEAGSPPMPALLIKTSRLSILASNSCFACLMELISVTSISIVATFEIPRAVQLFYCIDTLGLVSAAEVNEIP